MKREKEPLIWFLLFIHIQLKSFPKMCVTSKYRVPICTAWITQLNSFSYTMMFNNSAILGLSSLGRVDITKTFYSFNNENCIIVSNYDSEFSFQLYPHQIACTSSTLLRLCPYSYLQTIINLFRCKIQTRDRLFYKRFNCHFLLSSQKENSFRALERTSTFRQYFRIWDLLA